jgi:hypothetical protein
MNEPNAPIHDEHGPGCPARYGMGDCDEKPTVRYSVLRPCAICGKRPEDRTVVMDDIPTGICDVCWEKGTEEAEPYRGPEDWDLEGQPEFNGAFR